VHVCGITRCGHKIVIFGREAKRRSLRDNCRGTSWRCNLHAHLSVIRNLPKLIHDSHSDREVFRRAISLIDLLALPDHLRDKSELAGNAMKQVYDVDELEDAVERQIKLSLSPLTQWAVQRRDGARESFRRAS
jgi:hypothetical protein